MTNSRNSKLKNMKQKINLLILAFIMLVGMVASGVVITILFNLLTNKL